MRKWLKRTISQHVRQTSTKPTRIPNDGKTLKDFIKSKNLALDESDDATLAPKLDPNNTQVYIETYGCQMNVSDSEIISSILEKSGYAFTKEETEADIILLNTCAIRDNAEQKIWSRLYDFRALKRKNKVNVPVVGVLGCMAERLKTKLLETEQLVDIVAGPDSYRDLPTLLENSIMTDTPGINVMLSQEETYADIAPVRKNTNGTTAFVSIMRGCNNMCSFCIVPFTRGRERSRPIESIEKEVLDLWKDGFKEITLLGQNVNSYNDVAIESESTVNLSNPGFKTIYKPPKGGIQFIDLLDRISQVVPEMRIRFTSPHPKDFPEDLIKLIHSRPNICKFIHMPAQSGSTAVLERMRRGYSREAYLDLIKNFRKYIPNVSLSTDIIAGFCGETQQDHLDTLALMQEVRYDNAFMFAYSLREKTHAHRNYQDDVDPEVKKRRLEEIISLHRKILGEIMQEEVGKRHLILLEGEGRREQGQFFGKTDTFKNVCIPKMDMYKLGDFVEVEIIKVSGATLIGHPIGISSISQFSK